MYMLICIRCSFDVRERYALCAGESSPYRMYVQTMLFMSLLYCRLYTIMQMPLYMFYVLCAFRCYCKIAFQILSVGDI